MSNTSKNKSLYYLPGPSHWPLVGSIGLFCIMFGAANWLHGKLFGPYLFLFGSLIMAIMLFGWFGTVIQEGRAGLLKNAKMDRTYRWGMIWFIFSEVMFFATFFGALFYTRTLSVPTLAGGVHGVMTHKLLWPQFHGGWPVYKNPDPKAFIGPNAILHVWGIPALNTLILLCSGGTMTIAHWALLKKRREVMVIAQCVTAFLGIIFLGMQAYEYGLAYTEMGLKLSSGIYGSTFFMLTGFHAMHVLLGIIMIIVMIYRMGKQDFTPKDHFAFEATAWYWHFVDVVWLMLFIFVYWL